MLRLIKRIGFIKQIRAWHYRRRIIQAALTLSMLDKVIVHAGYDRATRRRFWNAMHKGREEVVKVLIDIASATSKRKMGPSRGGGDSRVG